MVKKFRKKLNQQKNIDQDKIEVTLNKRVKIYNKILAGIKYDTNY